MSARAYNEFYGWVRRVLVEMQLRRVTGWQEYKAAYAIADVDIEERRSVREIFKEKTCSLS